MLALFALCSVVASSSADDQASAQTAVIVFRNGERLIVRAGWTIEPPLVKFIGEGGIEITAQLAQVDLAATRRANSPPKEQRPASLAEYAKLHPGHGGFVSGSGPPPPKPMTPEQRAKYESQQKLAQGMAIAFDQLGGHLGCDQDDGIRDRRGCHLRVETTYCTRNYGDNDAAREACLLRAELKYGR